MITMEMSQSSYDETVRELTLRLSLPRARGFFSNVTSQELHSIMVVAQRIVPYLTGELHDSAYETVGGSFDRVTAQGGFTADHAVPVHERINVKHRTGTAKYLEIPWRKWQSGGLAIFAAHAKKYFIVGVKGSTGFYARRGPVKPRGYRR